MPRGLNKTIRYTNMYYFHGFVALLVHLGTLRPQGQVVENQPPSRGIPKAYKKYILTCSTSRRGSADITNKSPKSNQNITRVPSLGGHAFPVSSNNRQSYLVDLSGRAVLVSNEPAPVLTVPGRNEPLDMGPRRDLIVLDLSLNYRQAITRNIFHHT